MSEVHVCEVRCVRCEVCEVHASEMCEVLHISLQ